MLLNREQAQCIDEDGHCLVVACPGSGKTRVITQKIAALLERHPEAKIIGVTFTRDSAGELSERVTKAIGQARFKQSCRIGTFHSLAIRQLRSAGLLGALASPAQQNALMARAMSQSQFDGDWDQASRIIEAAKTALSEHEATEHPLYLAYAELLSRQKLVDLYDVLRNAVQFMRSGQIPPYPAQFMLVDEFQDTDHVQMAWILEHAKHGTAITCVGDDDQSIYSWRGALGNAGMLDFQKNCNAKLITLGQNYRSHAEILSFADTIIRMDQSRIPKSLIAASGSGGAVALCRTGSAENEAETVADAIEQHVIPLSHPSQVFTHTTPAGSWAVLARGRRYLDLMESELQARHIEYRRAASESIWNRPPFLHMLTLLRSLQTGAPDGVDSALHHTITIQLGIHTANSVMDKLHQLGGNRFSHLLDGHIPAGAGDSLLSAEMQIVASFATTSANLRKLLAAGQYRNVITAVALWFENLEKDPKAQQLVRRIGTFLADLKGSLVSRTSALGQQNAAAGDAPKTGVVLSTIHSSKGLEFDHVWIVGCNDNIIPNAKAGNLPEERRLLYVAVTRPKQYLYLSATTESKVSPLLTEAGVVFATAS